MARTEGVGFRGLGLRVLEVRVSWFRGLGLRCLGVLGL